MRIIPRKTKLNTTVWKSFTIVDIAIALIVFIITIAVIMSNIPGKLYIVLCFIPLVVVLLVPDGEGGRAYGELGALIRYIFSRKKYSVEAHGAANVDSLVPPFRFVSDGIGACVLDYGSYVGGVIAVDSVEFGLYSETRQNEAISALARAFNIMTIGDSAKIIKIDRPIIFDDVAVNTFSKLQSSLVDCDMPSKKARSAILKSRLNTIDAFNNLQKFYRPYYYLVFFSPTVSSLSALCNAATDALSIAGLSPRRLNCREAVAMIKYTYTQDFDEREIEMIDEADYADFIRPKNIKFALSNRNVDGKYAFAYAVANYPLTVSNAWGAALFDIPDTKVVLNIHPVEQIRAVKRIDRTVTEIGARDQGKASEVIDASTHIETMGALLQAIQNGNENLFDCAIVVTGYNNNEQESPSALRKRVRQAICTQGFRPVALRARQLDGFVAESLCQKDPLKKYARGINSESLAAIFPFVFTSIIEPEGMTLGEANGYPFIFDPFKWEHAGGEYINANMFIAGTSGSGKSYFAKSLLAQMYSDNCRIYILDPENEYKYLCRNVGGRFIDVGTALTGRINPFHIYQILTEDGTPAAPPSVFSAHQQYLENFFAATLPGISSDTLEEINNLVTKCYALHGITENTDCSKYAPEQFPTFDNLYKLVCEELKKEKGSGLRFDNLTRAQSYLAKFAQGGRFSNLWNGPSTLAADDDFIVFNFQSLFESKNKVTVGGQMLTVLRFMEQQIINLRERNAKAEDVIRPIIAIDEGYMYIDENNPAALDFIYQWYKRIRKYQGAMIFLTQNLADIVGNKDIVQKTSAIINNTQYAFLMTLQGKDVEVLDDIFASRNLTNAELDLIQRSDKPKGSAFFMGSARQRAMLHVITASDIEALFSGAVDIDDEFNSNENTAASAE